MRKLLLCLSLCFSPNLFGAEEHPVCNDASHDWLRHTAERLRELAASCQSSRFSELNFHRAYYRDLVSESDAAAALIDYNRSEGRSNLRAYAFHMLLTEQMARHYFPTMAGQLSYLISEYEKKNEIAELWLRGYNNLANRLSELQTRRGETE